MPRENNVFHDNWGSTMKRTLLFLFAFASLAVRLQAKPPTEPEAKPQISQFVLYAERSVKIGHRSHAEGGDVGVRTAMITAQDGAAQLRIEEHGKCRNVFSPSTSLENDAEVRNIWTNSLKRVKDTEIGTQGKFPADMPLLPLALASGTGADVTVAEHKAQSLAPGTYGAVVLHEGGTLRLEAGRYVFASLKMGERSQLLGERGGVDLRIVNGLQMREHAKIEPHWDDAKAKDFTIAVAGGDPATIADPALGPPTNRMTPTTVVSIGREARIHGLLAAPHGTIWMAEEAHGKGAFAGFDIVTGEHVEVEFESGFPVSAPGQQGSQQLHGYVKGPMSSAPLIGPVPQNEILNVAVGLPHRDPNGLAAFIGQVTNPKSPLYRHYLTPAKFVATYSPTMADYQALTAFAQANGLSVTQSFSNNGLLRVSGPAAAIERTFYVNLNNYARPDNSSFYALDRDPSLDLTVSVLRVSGLDNYVVGTTSAGSGAGGSFQGNDFRNAYLGAGSPCATLTGAGQSIGLFELDSYNPPDITQYEALAGLPNVALNPVSILSASGGGGPSSVSNAGTRLEVAGDIEMVASMAPGSTITPFLAPNTGGTDTTNAILNAMATQTPLSFQISNSWNTDADDNTAQAVAQLAAQGQSLFHSSGDFGAYGANPPGGLKDIDYPYATVVGGTVLTMNGAGASYKSETTWTGSGGGFLQYPSIASILDVPIPDYQKGFINSSNGGSNQFRNIPDVSAVATGLVCVVGGAATPCAGTSFAAPLWAGFIALMNQQGQINASPQVGFINPAIYTVAGTGLYGTAFNDINDGSTNSNNGSVTGFAAVTGYDLATGLGSPQCGLIPALVGGPGGAGGGGGGGGGGGAITVNVSATETQVGPDVCVKGTGFTPGGRARAEYFGVPRRVGPESGRSATVKPDGSFAMDIDTSSEHLVGSCNDAELGNTVTINVTETDTSNNVIGTGNTTMPAAYWCANALLSTNLNGGCP